MGAAVNYVVVTDALRAAADAARNAGQQAAPVNLAGTADQVGVALPGSRSAAAAGDLADFWRQSLESWSRDIAAHGDQLANAVTAYTGSEERAVTELRGAAPSPIGPGRGPI